MKPLSLTLEKAWVLLKVFLRLQTHCIQIINRKNKLGAHSVKSHNSVGCILISSYNLQVPVLTATIKSFFVMSLLFSSFGDSAYDMTQEKDKGEPYPEGFTTASSSRTNCWQTLQSWGQNIHRVGETEAVLYRGPEGWAWDSLTRQMSSGILYKFTWCELFLQGPVGKCSLHLVDLLQDCW